MVQFWDFLNQNFISSVLEALFFGLIAAYLFYRFSGAAEKKALLKQTKQLLLVALQPNIETARVLLDQLNKNDVTRVPRPMDTTIMNILLQGKFTEIMGIELIKQIAEVYRISELINKDYEVLQETFNGLSVSIVGIQEIRNKIVKESIIRIKALQNAMKTLQQIVDKLN